MLSSSSGARQLLRSITSDLILEESRANQPFNSAFEMAAARLPLLGSSFGLAKVFSIFLREPEDTEGERRTEVTSSGRESNQTYLTVLAVSQTSLKRVVAMGFSSCYASPRGEEKEEEFKTGRKGNLFFIDFRMGGVRLLRSLGQIYTVVCCLQINRCLFYSLPSRSVLAFFVIFCYFYGDKNL